MSAEDADTVLTDESVADLVRRLAAVDVCSVSDALDALGLEGVVTGIGPVWEGAKLAGRAVTVRLAEAPAPAHAPKVHLGVRAIQASRPGDVIVVDNDARVGMGAWGGLLSRAAIAREVAGVIADGACRDVDEARELRFPVFARAGAAQTARGRVYEQSTGKPVHLGGVAVRTGDIVVADGSGVAVLSRENAASVVAKAEELTERESRMRELLQSGAPAAEVLGGAYEKMLD